MQADAAARTESEGLRYTGIRLYTFQQMYSSAIASRENVQQAIQAPRDVPGGGLDIVPRPTFYGGERYLYAGVSDTRRIGASDVEHGIHLISSRDLLTPAEVEDAIREQIEKSAAESHGTFAHYTIEGITFTGIERLIPTRR